MSANTASGKPAAPADDPLLSYRDIERKGGPGKDAVRRLAENGKLKIIRLSKRCIRIRQSEWERCLNELAYGRDDESVPNSSASGGEARAGA